MVLTASTLVQLLIYLTIKMPFSNTIARFQVSRTDINI